MLVKGVPDSTQGRIFDIEFTVEDGSWEAEWKNKKDGHVYDGDVIEKIISGTLPIDIDNDAIICRGIGDVFEECASEDTQPPALPAELIALITKFDIRLIPLDEADLVINSLFYGPHIRDPGDVSMNTLFEVKDGEEFPLWAGVYWHHKAVTLHGDDGMPLARGLALKSFSEDQDAMDMVGTLQPYDIWLEAWDEEGNPEITRAFRYPAIVIVRNRD